MTCEDIKLAIASLFECGQHDERFLKVRTPFLYPDGDLIDVFVTEGPNGIVVTDLGETARWLRGQTVASRRSPKQKQLIQDICSTHGVEFTKAMITARPGQHDAVADAIVRVGQAAVRVADLWFTFRTRAVQSITDEVADFLVEREIDFERAVKVQGVSGKAWTVDFETRTTTARSLVSVLATGSRVAARGVTEHVVATWFDLRELRIAQERVRLISLFDDTIDVWAEEDFKQVTPLSDVARWSRPDEFEQLIGLAAQG